MKKSVKKWTSIALSAAMVMAMAGCGGSADTQPAQTQAAQSEAQAQAARTVRALRAARRRPELMR